MRRAVLFDLDGVLLDSRQTVLAALAGIATIALSRRVAISELPPQVLTLPRVEALAALGVAEPDALCETWWDVALATAPTPAVIPGVLDAVTALKEVDTATGVVTLQERVRLDWLLPGAVRVLLDVTVCWHDAAPKPAPDGILLALAKLGVAPFEAAFVGDNRGDIVAARAAGVIAIGAGWGLAGPAALNQAGADPVLENPDSLTAALKALTGRGIGTAASGQGQ